LPRKGPTEQDVLRIVMELGDMGILQSELWKKLTADSREGSRAILRLEKKGLIARKKELHEGRWTYRVFAKRRYSTIESIVDIPCAFCDLVGSCPQSWIMNSNKCQNLTKWLLEQAASAKAVAKSAE
jgi:predicted transcriptional regulator